jgi:hypothetical protein
MNTNQDSKISQISQERLTVYDAFSMMKSFPEMIRYRAQGAVIIAAPSILKYSSGMDQKFGDVHDSRYKLKIAQVVRDTLISYSTHSIDQLTDDIINLNNMPIVRDYQGVGKRGMNLPYEALQINTLLTEKQKEKALTNIGRITENTFKSFYKGRGYKLNPIDRHEHSSSYLIAECEFFTRIVAEIANRSRKY